MPAFEAREGMPYWIDLHSSDLRKSTYFYSKVLGWNIAQADKDSPYLIARKDGLPVAGMMLSEGSLPDDWVTYFYHRDVEQVGRNVATAGGRVLAEPTNVALGRLLVAADAAGGLFGVLEPGGEESFIAAGEPGTVVWHDYLATSQFEDVTEFYQRVLGWDLKVSDQVAIALADGGAFASLRDVSAAFGSETPSFWQPFLGVASVDEAARRVAEFGGEVVRAPFESEFGRMTIIEDSTGAAVTLCEAPEPVDESEMSEAEDLFSL